MISQYEDDEEENELLARRIKAMHVAADVATNATPRDVAGDHYDAVLALQEHYQGNPGVNPEPGVFINPEGESLDLAEPNSAATARQANAILADILGDEFTNDHKWNVEHFARMDAKRS